MPALDLMEGSVIRFGDIRLDVPHTPGHTEGSVCLLAEGQRLIKAHGLGSPLVSGELHQAAATRPCPLNCPQHHLPAKAASPMPGGDPDSLNLGSLPAGVVKDGMKVSWSVPTTRPSASATIKSWRGSASMAWNARQ